ncbi:3-phosphoserine/phosphohydroxythreonine transaminase [Variovorax sp. PCZ-1]|uniref:3-phosphoserine/phosphohydroxythreonine transaminase n=1 Tax=Variovorax sp. PCZ-1 TaxID=2835533 RepID=UPI001BCB0B76|nr:3-phosphoserine/phosphohydroxythreonine transaminase [Variovorax sp. PCZ-1]MBS7808585.1 3-phosphoserine/phosphohydroxythreonine transaminase [Variovorax sp. PCZ-1]
MPRVHNFSAGPAMLPQEVLQIASEEMLDWQGSGMSVMEMSHRGPEFIGIYERAVADLRSLLAIPENYKVIFLQGGGLGENAIVPMNMLRGKSEIDFVVTGTWSEKSAQEAAKFAKVNIAASAKADGFTHIPAVSSWKQSANAAYLHICQNETIDGVEFQGTPDIGNQILVSDVSSMILSRPMDVSKYGLIFGGAQKNIGPAGLTIVIVREDLLGGALAYTPDVFNYAVQGKADSMYNTPPTYAIYIAGLVFQWLKKRGGLAAMQAHNATKASLLYDALDASDFYKTKVQKAFRSRMNVPFFLPDEKLYVPFLKGADERGLLQLKGHRSVGGLRASIYNAMPLEGVQALVSYLAEFEKSHG